MRGSFEREENMNKGGGCLNHSREGPAGLLPLSCEGACGCGQNPSQCGRKTTCNPCCQQERQPLTNLNVTFQQRRNPWYPMRCPEAATSFWHFDYSGMPPVYRSSLLLLWMTGMHTLFCLAHQKNSYKYSLHVDMAQVVPLVGFLVKFSFLF